MILKIKIPHQMGSASFLQSVPYNNQTGLCQRQAHAIGIVKQEHNKNKHVWVWLPAFWLRESVVNCSLSVPSTNPLHCKLSISKCYIHGNKNTQGAKEDNELAEWNYYWNSVPYPFSERSTAYSQKLCTFDNQMIQIQIAFHAWKHHLRLGNVCFLRGVPRHLQVLSECIKSATDSVGVKDVVKTWKPGSYWLACHRLSQSPAQTILSKKHSTKDGRRQS